ncbi:putative reverse transcriptase domain-containing protein [Tanacetum coccineum]
MVIKSRSSNVKAMMTTEYCPATEIQRMEQELWTLTLKGDDIEAYNNRFHELALTCHELVPTEKKKIKRYVRGFPERIKGNITSSKPAPCIRQNMAHELCRAINCQIPLEWQFLKFKARGPEKDLVHCMYQGDEKNFDDIRCCFKTSLSLKNLKEKGFIRPSQSPWGTCSFVRKKTVDAECACCFLKDRSLIRISSVEDVRQGRYTGRPHLEHPIWALLCSRSCPFSEEEHEAHLKMILDLLKKEKLYAKFSKCEFWLQEVQFLGHMVNHDGIHVDPSKVESVKNWKTPESSLNHALRRKKTQDHDELRAMSITIHLKLRLRFLEAQSELLRSQAPTEWLRGLERHFEQRDDGEIYFFDRIWIPSVGGVRKLIMDEAHTSRYSVHPGADKMYYDLRDLYWWPEIPEWKWEKITMDFVTKLPKSSSGHDTIWVVVDRLTKSAHFLPIREDYKTEKLAKIYTNEIVARHGVLCQSFRTVMVRLSSPDAQLFRKRWPIEILERDVKKLKRRRIPLVKVRWNSRQGAEYTWECEDQFRNKYPNLFSEPVPSSGVAT